MIYFFHLLYNEDARSFFMKKIYFAFNLLLVILIGACLFIKPHTEVVSLHSISKMLPSGSISGNFIQMREINKKETNSVDLVVTNSLSKISNNLVGASVMTDVLETQVGTMSAYGLDCDGCSGVVGARYDALGNHLIYHDPTYGDLRIVAGDKKYPYGTVVRVVDSKIGTFGVIVLDRGSDIGIGRRYLFDLLFYTEADAYEFCLSRNTTFEVLRYGY